MSKRTPMMPRQELEATSIGGEVRVLSSDIAKQAADIRTRMVQSVSERFSTTKPFSPLGALRKIMKPPLPAESTFPGNRGVHPGSAVRTHDISIARPGHADSGVRYFAQIETRSPGSKPVYGALDAALERYQQSPLDIYQQDTQESDDGRRIPVGAPKLRFCINPDRGTIQDYTSHDSEKTYPVPHKIIDADTALLLSDIMQSIAKQRS